MVADGEPGQKMKESEKSVKKDGTTTSSKQSSSRTKVFTFNH